MFDQPTSNLYLFQRDMSGSSVGPPSLVDRQQVADGPLGFNHCNHDSLEVCFVRYPILMSVDRGKRFGTSALPFNVD
jgi:hypothetical protein